jgi:hypothetical protein
LGAGFKHEGAVALDEVPSVAGMTLCAM